jgi:hypothetical protein
LKKLTKNDRVELIRAGKDTTKLHPFSYAKNTIYHAIRKSSPEDTTNQGKAIHTSIMNLTHEIGPRAVIFLTPGDAPYSSKQFSLQSLIHYARVNGIQIYPILLNRPQEEDQSWSYLANETGGRLFIVRENEESEIYETIQSNLDSRYVISYETEVKSFLSAKWIPLILNLKYRDFGGKTEGGYFVP